MKKTPSGFFILFKIKLLVLPFVIGAALSGSQAPPAARTAQAATPPTPELMTVVPKLLKPAVDPFEGAAPAPAIPTPTAAPAAAAAAPASAPSLIGSIGYARAGGNCVNEPGINNPRNGNPSSWPVTSRTPWIGATAVFTWNHAGVVTGIWSNGDIEVRHQNYWGGQHRFPQSMIRGYR